MKSLYGKLSTNLMHSFSAKHFTTAHFDSAWHAHEELELRYIIRGEGVRFIGDNINCFAPGEIILLGGKLTHAWRCSEAYYQNDPEYHAEAIILQFLPECLGKPLLQLPESYLLPRLFEKAKNGLILRGETRRLVSELMQKCMNENGLGKIITLLQIFKILAESNEYESITATRKATRPLSELENKRLNRIFDYTYAHYKEDIALDHVANMANLSLTSFCRYFKTMTDKTYYDFLIEIRISHACRLLVENHFSTEEICFACGFNNISNFYRHFKRVIGQTPLAYKKLKLIKK